VDLDSLEGDVFFVLSNEHFFVSYIKVTLSENFTRVDFHAGEKLVTEDDLAVAESEEAVVETRWIDSGRSLVLEELFLVEVE
jgi:hypothetical protein